MKTATGNEVRDGLFYVDGHLLELDPDSFRTEDLLSTPRLFDGFQLCLSCKDVLVLCDRKYCRNCTRLERDLEAKFDLQPPADRIDMGIVPCPAPFDALEPQAIPSNLAVCAILGGIGAVAMFALTGMWYVGRGLIGICLDATK